MAISKDLVEYLLFDNLKYFHTNGKPVAKTTVLGTALASSKVAGSTAQSMFKDVSRYDISMNGGVDKPWPDNWVTLTCETLAPSLV
ncbi:MAG: hypothetical protein JWQ07_92 [Ramlibacter sp.]|nr:hypothetical protein [Ramlibacter sp.]